MTPAPTEQTALAHRQPPDAGLLGPVVVPVCLMLLGGFLIGRGYPVGSILAWWTPLLAAADGLWTLALIPRLDWDRPGAALAVAAAALVETLLATWAVQRLLRP